jgi:hypothetical protein
VPIRCGFSGIRSGRYCWSPALAVHPDRLSGEAATNYVGEWITGLTDITTTAHEIRDLVAVRSGCSAEAGSLVLLLEQQVFRISLLGLRDSHLVPL